MATALAHTISSGLFSWKGKKVLVTGGAGLLGGYLVEDLLRQGATVRVVDNLSGGLLSNLEDVKDQVEFIQGDLRDREIAISAASGIDVVMHLAARAHGMLFSMANNAEILKDNCLMSLHVLDACCAQDVQRVLMVSSSCVYDDDGPFPTPELPVHIGLPESVNEGYGWAKRILEIHSRYVYEETGLPIALVRPFNAYGGRYRWVGEASHVVPSLVKKVLDNNGPVTIWGSGNQVRDLLHARDLALGFRLAVESAVDCDPINLAGGTAIRLVDLVERIAQMAGLVPTIEFDTKKSEGRIQKTADLTKLQDRIPAFRPTVPLEEGLQDMRDWYKRSRELGCF